MKRKFEAVREYLEDHAGCREKARRAVASAVKSHRKEGAITGAITYRDFETFVCAFEVER